jgi:hypothetical protein
LSQAVEPGCRCEDAPMDTNEVRLQSNVARE